MAELERITLGGGCFWCLEAVYLDVKGVKEVLSGYAGGHVENPTYRAVCAETTGHAEVVDVVFDPDEIDLKSILSIFFTIHDPTTLNRQGNDRGTQYRSIILYRDDAQKMAVEEVMQEIAGLKLYADPLVTELEPLETFYVAEDYHQNYYANNMYQGYCRVVVAPKVNKFRQKFASLRK